MFAARQEIAPAANITPENAIKSFAFPNARPILNDYAFGGYLDFVGIPPFIDGRGELYGAAFTLRHDRAVNLRDLPDFLRMLDEYRIGTTLLAPTTPAVALLDRVAGLAARLCGRGRRGAYAARFAPKRPAIASGPGPLAI